ncbi:sulfite exporter TauE/SafE family protein [Aestuariicella hydrocarbonica]|uniref:Probable membrane transporter protein n=1 Tax=Pseudomaricurvus hydrocarbonicus TaxID=1470433 RepID=A0A9E5JT66_9GAMM|nr:sulfite exporter TauE/SafE family protein [Aestuariicella hydrocarbonica]
MELTPVFIALLLVTGLIAGVINTLAGGGSNLTLPALMVMGLPADVANATNRVGVFFQCLVGLKGFDRHGKLERTDIKGILIPTLAGGLVGALFASFLPVWLLKPVLLGTMVTMALLILLRPSAVMPAEEEMAGKVSGNPKAWGALLLAGFYGGFVQAGVGFVLIAALAGVLRYDLVRANALKLLCSAAFTAVALGIFIWQGQVAWVPGLVLAVGTMVGARLGVGMAMKVSQKTLKWFLFVMTLCASVAALLF